MLWSYLTVTLLMLVGLLLIFIILLQRGRGGGLAGAFGGAGGQSALGTKAGDVFTRITIVLASVWVALACVSIYALRAEAAAKGRSIVAKSALAPGEETVGPAADDTNATPATTPEPAGPAAEKRTTGAGAFGSSSPEPKTPKTPAAKPSAKTTPAKTPAEPKPAAGTRKPAETTGATSDATAK